MLWVAPWATFVEVARWIAVTENPAVLRAARILDPRLPVACELLDFERGSEGQGGVCLPREEQSCGMKS